MVPAVKGGKRKQEVKMFACVKKKLTFNTRAELENNDGWNFNTSLTGVGYLTHNYNTPPDNYFKKKTIFTLKKKKRP